MCDFQHDGLLPPLSEDEYVLDTRRVREFIGAVRERIKDAGSPAQACEDIGPLFADLLSDRDWLPARYQAPAAASGMGGGIGQWLVFRAADRTLSLFSLVVPPGAMTPVHDHLAWGLVGVYTGNQDEEFYRPGRGRLELVRRRPLDPGDFSRCCRRATTSTAFVPPRRRHRSRSMSGANDTGCVWRHTYDEQTGEVNPFRSGYVNAECFNDNQATNAVVTD